MSPPTPAARTVRSFLFAFVAAVIWGIAWSGAAESRPVVGPGATRDEAIKAYGWPTGQTQTGSREILIYPQGRIFLEKGKVERVDFSPTMAWPAPRPRPPGPKTSSLKQVDAPVDFWLTDWVEAQTEAERRHARILILFTGLDWSPASRQFQDEVSFEPEFVNAFTGDFVFLRLDFPSRAAQTAALKQQNAMLRERYGVTTYPSLLMVSASGVLQGRVDLEAPRSGETYRARVMIAVREARDTIIARPPPVDPATKEAVPPGAGSAKESVGGGAMGLAQLSASLSSAGWLLVTSLVGGWVFVIATLLWLWRRGPATHAVSSTPAVAEAVASPLISLSNSKEWSKLQLCQVVARLAEAEGHRVAQQPSGTDADLSLTRTGETRPRALVLCVPASAGLVTPRRLREFHAAMTIEGVEAGWVVGIAGFSAEARAFAEQKTLEVIDAPALADRLDALPPLARRRLFSGEG
jgi:hypothetical protein